MSLKFTIEFKVPDSAGVLTDATGTPTIGIIRLDTSAVIVAAGTAMVHDSTGVYSYTLASPVAGKTYRATWVAVVNGESLTDQFDLTASTSTAAGYYTDYQGYADQLGVTELLIIDDPDNDLAENMDLVQRSLDYADAKINQRLAAFGYTVPLANMDADTVTTMRANANMIGIEYLNRSRGLVSIFQGLQGDASFFAKLVAGWLAKAEGELAAIGFGSRVIVADRTDSYDAAPTAITGNLDNNDVDAWSLANQQRGCCALAWWF